MSDLALAAFAGLVATEATGLTNFSGSGSDDRDPPISIPQPQGPSLGDVSRLIDAQTSDGPDTGAIAQAIASASQSAPTVIETGAGGGGGGGGTTAAFQSMIQQLQNQNQDLAERVRDKTDETTETIETTRDTTELVREIRKWRENLPTPNPDGSNGADGSDGRDTSPDDYDLQTDYQGFLSEEVSGSAEILARLGETGKNLGTEGTDFAEENPYVTGATATGAAAGSIVPGVGNIAGTGAGFLAGSVAEITADTVTGGTPLGVQSPINNDDDGAVWDGPDPLNLGRFTGDDESDQEESDRQEREQTDPLDQYEQTLRDDDEDPDHTAGKPRSGGGRLLARVR